VNGSFSGLARKILATPDGGWIVTGTRLDPDRGQDGLLIRLDSTGRKLWSVQHDEGLHGSEDFWDAVLAPDGSILISGMASLRSEVIKDPEDGPQIINTGTAALWRFDAEGRRQWMSLITDGTFTRAQFVSLSSGGWVGISGPGVPEASNAASRSQVAVFDMNGVLHWRARQASQVAMHSGQLIWGDDTKL